MEWLMDNFFQTNLPHVLMGLAWALSAARAIWEIHCEYAHPPRRPENPFPEEKP